MSLLSLVQGRVDGLRKAQMNVLEAKEAVEEKDEDQERSTDEVRE
jgi:hypothetical protein